MSSNQDLKLLMQETIEKERKFTKFYDSALAVIPTGNFQETLVLIKDNHEKNITILENIDISDFGNDEWMRSIPDYSVDEYLKPGLINEHSKVDEIVTIIIAFETNMKNFYATIADQIVTQNEKDLFYSLSSLKEKQIYDVKRFIET